MSTRVAVLGTGRMGSAIARRLAETGIELVLWNRTRSRAEAVGAGIVVANPVDAVAKVDVVITSLTEPDALRETFNGPTGALAMARGQSFVERCQPYSIERGASCPSKSKRSRNTKGLTSSPRSEGLISRVIGPCVPPGVR
jgi:2-polyprenyl-6-methoxyphenol hydroxylase-like FAD-dependent oxidoreductase